MGNVAINVESLTAEERLDLLEKLWDSLSKRPGLLPLTEPQKRELDRRLDALDRDVEQQQPLGVPWDEVLKQIRAR